MGYASISGTRMGEDYNQSLTDHYVATVSFSFYVN